MRPNNPQKAILEAEQKFGGYVSPASCLQRSKATNLKNKT